MLLAIDVGNTQIVIGLLDDQKVRFRMRCATAPDQTADEYAFLLHNFFELHKVQRTELHGAILSSVVPKLKQALRQAVHALFGMELMIVGPGIKNGLNIKIDNPAELGSDLVVDAVAALHFYPAPLVVIDMGTATTLSIIDKNKVYQGGLIIPGLSISIDALVSRTSQLKRIEISAPERLIGKNTEECMKAGAIFGQAAMLDGLLMRIEAEMGTEVTAVATGGVSGDIVEFCQHKVIYNADLMLHGLYLIYQKNLKSRLQ